MWGVYGASITTVISEIIVLFITLFAAGKYHAKFRLGHTFLVVGIGCALIVGICYWTNRLIDNDIINLIVSVGISCIAYGSCLIIGKKELLIQTIKKLKK